MVIIIAVIASLLGVTLASIAGFMLWMIRRSKQMPWQAWSPALPTSQQQLMLQHMKLAADNSDDSSSEHACFSGMMDAADLNIHGPELGEGASGKVLRASLHGIMPVAVKIISQDTAQKWLRVVDEIRIMKEKPCPYLVQYLGACIKDSKLMIVMELMYSSLACAIMSGHTADSTFLWHRLGKSVALEVALSLHHLHCQSEPIVHRDLKAANVLIDVSGHAKLGDVGLARILQLPSICETERNSIAGTWTHMAPEALRGQAARRSSDIWAFGMLLLEIVIHVVPARRGEITLSDIRDLPEGACPLALKSLIRDCLQDKPSRRPSSLRLTSVLTTLAHGV